MLPVQVAELAAEVRAALDSSDGVPQPPSAGDPGLLSDAARQQGREKVRCLGEEGGRLLRACLLVG